MHVHLNFAIAAGGENLCQMIAQIEGKIKTIPTEPSETWTERIENILIPYGKKLRSRSIKVF